jgi:hypothetical protein
MANTMICRSCEKEISDREAHFRMLVPLYHSENHLPDVMKYLNTLHEVIPGGVTVDFIVDGRIEDEVALFGQISKLKASANVISLSRNFGVGPALHAGIASRNTCMVSAVGSDLQEPLELYEDFFAAISSGEYDVALGQRRSRKDPFLPRILAQIYWRINRSLVNSRAPLGGFDVFAMSEGAASSFVKLAELNTNFTSQLLWIGYRVKWIKFDRTARISGKSTWTLRRKFKLFADSLYGYTAKPLTWMTWAGFLATVILLFVAGATGVARALGLVDIPGYTTLVLLFALGQSLTLLSIGILGGYIYRAFENSTGRPNYVIRKIYEKPQ